MICPWQSSATNRCVDLFRTAGELQNQPRLSQTEKIAAMTKALIDPGSPLLFGPIHTLALSRTGSFKSNRRLTKKIANGSYKLTEAEKKSLAEELVDEFHAFFVTGLSYEGRAVSFGHSLTSRRYRDGIDESFFFMRSTPRVLEVTPEINARIEATIKDWNKRGNPKWTRDSFLKVRDALIEIKNNPELESLFVFILGNTIQSSAHQLYYWQIGLNLRNRLAGREGDLRNALSELARGVEASESPNTLPEFPNRSSELVPTVSTRNAEPTNRRNTSDRDIPPADLTTKELILHHFTESVPVLFGNIHIWAASRIPFLKYKVNVGAIASGQLVITNKRRAEIAENMYDELHAFFQTGRATRWRLTEKNYIRLTSFGEPLSQRRYRDGVDESWTSNPQHSPSPKHVERAVRAWNKRGDNWTTEDFHKARNALIQIDNNPTAQAALKEILGNSIEAIIPGLRARQSRIPFRSLLVDRRQTTEEGNYVALNGPRIAAIEGPISQTPATVRTQGKDYLTETQFQQLLNSPSENRVEVGAETSPICSNCIQVDRYKSSADMHLQGLGNTAPPWVTGAKRQRWIENEAKKSDVDRILHFARLAEVHESEIWAPYAALLHLEELLPMRGISH